jgi:phosphatidylinositol-3,4,5-trisphosphate 3-phosphatase and dual-specificity protein phosphatase PTEN
MGWFWFIPVFHLPDPSSTGSTSTRFVLSRKEVDFPLGPGEDIIDVAVEMEWLHNQEPSNADVQMKDDNGNNSVEPSGLATAAEAVASGGVREGIETVQAAEE